MKLGGKRCHGFNTKQIKQLQKNQKGIQMKSQKLKILLGVLAMFAALQFSYGQGSRYTGSYTKSSPIRYEWKSNLVIEGLEISSSGIEAIGLYNCNNVIIRNCKIISPSNIGVYVWKGVNITIEDCVFENVQSGIRASTSQGIKFEHNDILNVKGNLHNKELGGMAHYMFVYGPGNSISYNVCENLSGQSEPEDIINIYDSNGTVDSPITVRGNWIRGGGTSLSGGGINIGDWGGSNQIAEDNIVVNPGQYGIAITGGQNMTLRNNKVYSQRIPGVSGVGMIVYNWYSSFAGAFSNVSIFNNKINFTHRDGYIDTWWIPEDKLITGKETNIYDKSLTASILPDKIIGRARDSASEPAPEIPGDGNVTPNPDEGSGPSTSPENGGVNSPISIYVDNFNRICVNCQGRVYRSANVSVANSSGKKIYTQPLTGYHTVIRSRLNSGTYSVTVRNGNTTQTQQVTVK